MLWFNFCLHWTVLLVTIVAVYVVIFTHVYQLIVTISFILFAQYLIFFLQYSLSICPLISISNSIYWSYFIAISHFSKGVLATLWLSLASLLFYFPFSSSSLHNNLPFLVFKIICILILYLTMETHNILTELIFRI